MKQHYTYHLGKFTEGTNLKKWIDNEDVENWLDRNGFEKKAGDSIAGLVDIHTHNENDEFLIFWSHDACNDGVYHVVGHPSFMMFYRDFVMPVVLCAIHFELTSEYPDTTNDYLKKIAKSVSMIGF